MKRLLILTQYFPPETGAPQNRLFELAVRLKKEGLDVVVLTAMPNYPKMEIFDAYKGKKEHYEEMQGIPVYRSSIFVSKDRGIVARLRNYFSFVISSRRAGKKIPGHFDYLMCESPPLFLGYSAMYLSKKKKAKLIFNVSDLWPESAEKLGVVNNQFLLKMAYNLEARLYRSSAMVSGQTQGICRSVNERFPSVKTYWLPNGADLTYYDPGKVSASDWRKRNGFSDEEKIFLYAGIVGIAQGLEVILHAAVKMKNEKCSFVILGSGPEKEKLQQLSSQLGTKNVKFMEPVGKAEMPGILRSVDAAIVPLKKLELFLGAIPSKIFEALAMEVPILLGVEGEAKDLFIDQGKCGVFFIPDDPESLAQAVSGVLSNEEERKQMGKRGRVYVNEYFNRDKIAESFYQRISSL